MYAVPAHHYSARRHRSTLSRQRSLCFGSATATTMLQSLHLRSLHEEDSSFRVILSILSDQQRSLGPTTKSERSTSIHIATRDPAKTQVYRYRRVARREYRTPSLL
ncbi:hypothetical protein MRB53_038677 [Persea americana]|nr:hypothetical protein MRB53_038677 [Persea americana]